MSLLHGDDWPPAVHPDRIANPGCREARARRGALIVKNFIARPVAGLKVLDYGCGDGLTAAAAAARGATVVGYDVVADPGWAEDGYTLTTRPERVGAAGPYDLILLYDVLDHCVTRPPADVLAEVRGLCHADTRVYVRCHPWCSRHGTHVFHTLNKAYVHLVLGEEDLASWGAFGVPTIKVTRPHATYTEWFAAAGLEVRDSREVLDVVPGFFATHPAVKPALVRHWPDEDPRPYMAQQFRDYVLSLPVA